MNRLPSFSKDIEDIYFISNSPSSFYKMMRENYFIQTQLAVLPTGMLIEEFYRLARSPIDSSREIANTYAVFVALTFKEPNEVRGFFEQSLSIKFEWFAEIAKYYLQNPTPSISYQSIVIQKNIHESNNIKSGYVIV